MDPEIAAFARSYQAFHEAMDPGCRQRAELLPLGEHVQDFLGVPLDEVEPITEYLPAAPVDRCRPGSGGPAGRVRRDAAGHQRLPPGPCRDLHDFLTDYFGSFALGPVAYERKATGPDSDRRVVALGLGEVRIDGVPLTWLQRTASPRSGRARYTLEVLCPDLATADRFLARVRERMAQLSILRGQVISFTANDFDYHEAGSELTFLARPQVTRGRGDPPRRDPGAGRPARGGHRCSSARRCSPPAST